jgi:hypothetical protein
MLNALSSKYDKRLILNSMLSIRVYQLKLGFK